MIPLNEYEKLIYNSRKKQSQLNLEQYKQIRDLYKDVAKSLQVKANKAKKGSLTERWAKDYKKAMRAQVKQMNAVIEDIISENIKKSAENATAIQLDFFDEINMRYSLGMSTSFKNMFSNVPNDVLKELVSGNFYKDGKGLSKRIWFSENKVNGDIDRIIQKGIAEKKSAYELAQDLQEYVDPDFKKDWSWKKVYLRTAKTIDYNAQRLARTSISHAYTLSMLRSCERNPFITKVRWHSVFAPGRTCPLCEERDGREYLLKECPMDHPNGMCYQEPVLNDSLEDIGTRLNKWANGSNDSELDDWYNKYGDFFSGESNNGIKKQRNNDIIKEKESKYPDIKTIKEAEDWALTNLNLKNVSYEGISLDVANYVNKSMGEIYNEYPILKGFVQDIKTDRKMKSVASAALSFEDGQINTKLNLSNKDLSDLKSIDDMINRCVEDKWWTPKEGVKGIIKHEMGHMIEYALTMKKYGFIDTDLIIIDTSMVNEAFKAINNGEISKDIKLKALSNLKILNTKQNIIDNLSEYGYSNTREFLAEAVSENNPRPLAQQTVKLLKEKIKEVWK